MYAQSYGNPYGSYQPYQSYQQSYGYSAYPQQTSYAYAPYQYSNCAVCEIPKAPVPQAASTPKKSQSPSKAKKTKSWRTIETSVTRASPEFVYPTKAAAPCGEAPAPCRGEPCDSKAKLPPYVSRVEESIRSSNRPIPANEVDIIEVNGVRGIWLNKAECESFKSEIPLSEYPINADSNPEVVKLRYADCADRVQQLSIKYLKPPKPQTPGPIIIKQEPNIPLPAAPPIIIRQIAEDPCPPPPVVIREKPPNPPEPICAKTIVVPGQRLPPPPRRVIIEKLAPAPPIPQAVNVERWLPYDKRERKVVLEKKPCDPCVEKPRNAVFEWEPQCVNPRTELNDLGVEAADPDAYTREHGSSLKSSTELPQFALDAKPPVPLDGVKEVNLVGDLEGLRLVNLEKEGLVQYGKYVR
jgi:hypothetical protein